MNALANCLHLTNRALFCIRMQVESVALSILSFVCLRVDMKEMPRAVVWIANRLAASLVT